MDGQRDGRTDVRVTGILFAQQCSGELKTADSLLLCLIMRTNGKCNNLTPT